MNELPGVGKNLQDHIDYVQSWRVPSNTETVGVSLRGAERWHSAIFEWSNKRTGLITTTYATAGAFIRSSPDVSAPDLQLIFVIAIVDDHARKLHMGHGISCHVDVLRPYSRGTVGLDSNDPRDAPVIDPQFLSDERDMKLLVKGAQIQQRIMESRPFDRLRGKMLYPTRSTIPPAWKRIFAAALTRSITRSAPVKWARTAIRRPWSMPAAGRGL